MRVAVGNKKARVRFHKQLHREPQESTLGDTLGQESSGIVV